MKGDDANFPIDVKSPLVNFLQRVILWSIKILAVLMVAVILWSVADVVFTLYLKTKDPYLFITDVDKLLGVFGSFLVVLIAIEIFLNLILYLKKDMSHLRLVIATALMAIARKVIILDYDKISDWHLIGMGVLILALGTAYWFVCHANQLHHPFPSLATVPDDKINPV
jgi:uncharacterized membrane protein (DUF373 family)